MEHDILEESPSSISNPIEGNSRVLSERSPLLNYDSNQQRLVRESVENAIASTYEGSSLILSVLGFFSICKISSAIIIISLFDNETSQPLQTFISGCIFMDAFNLFIIISKYVMLNSQINGFIKLLVSYFDFFLGL